MKLLTIALGSGTTKAALWSEDGLIALGAADIQAAHPRPGWVEEDPEGWWTSTISACAALPADERLTVDAVSFSARRETFVVVTTAGDPIGPAIASSDRRAAEDVAALGADFQVLTGIVPDAGTVAAKLAWMRRAEPERLDGPRWILGPRGLVAFRLTGRAVIDTSVASRTGLLTLDGARLEGANLLPEVVGCTAVVGGSLPQPSAALGIRPDTPVIAGAGDRACEVLGVAATDTRPLVLWDAAATSVSVPVGHVPPAIPGIVVTRGALGGYVMEADLSPAGPALTWLGHLAGRRPDDLAVDADGVDAGAGGLLALAWFGGARAPWWEPRVGLTFAGLAPTHTTAHLARAFVEGVAFDAVRCLDRTAPNVVELALAGEGAAMPLWRHILAGTANRQVVARRHREAASVGAAIIAGRAMGVELDPDRLDPIEDREFPFDSDVVAYAELRMRHEMVARATIGGIAGR
jgi:xylulokinase